MLESLYLMRSDLRDDDVIPKMTHIIRTVPIKNEAKLNLWAILKNMIQASFQMVVEFSLPHMLQNMDPIQTGK